MKREVKTIPTPVGSQVKAAEALANRTPSDIRHISSQNHQEIKRRLLILHEGLLRKLAEHDRQR